MYSTHNCYYLCIVKNCFASFSGHLGGDTKLLTLEKNLFVGLRGMLIKKKKKTNNDNISWNAVVIGDSLDQWFEKGVR